MLVQVAVQVTVVPGAADVGVQVMRLTISAPCTTIVATALSQAAGSGAALAGVAQIRYGTEYVPATAEAGTVTVPFAAMVSTVGVTAQPAQVTAPFAVTVALPMPDVAAATVPTVSLASRFTTFATLFCTVVGPSLTASMTWAVAVALDTAPPFALAALVDPVNTMAVLLSSPPPAMPGAV